MMIFDDGTLTVHARKVRLENITISEDADGIPILTGVVSEGTGGTGAPTDAQYLVLATHTDLTAERQFVVSSPLTLADSGANGSATLGMLSQSANTVFAGPTTGAATTPTFRALVSGDIPSLDTSKITTGTFADGRLSSNVALKASANVFTTSQIIQTSAGGNWALKLMLSGESQPRLGLENGGSLKWSDGTTIDATLFRSASGELTISSKLLVLGNQRIGSTTTASSLAPTKHLSVGSTTLSDTVGIDFYTADGTQNTRSAFYLDATAKTFFHKHTWSSNGDIAYSYGNGRLLIPAANGAIAVTGALTVSNGFTVSAGSVSLTGTAITGSLASLGVSVKATGDTLTRWIVQTDGLMVWGSGSSAADTNLYRSTANILKTDDWFEVTSGIRVNAPVFEGLGATTRWYRNLATYVSDTDAVAGAIVIKTGIPNIQSKMMRIRITGFHYHPTAMAVDFTAFGYFFWNGTTNQLLNHGVVNVGSWRPMVRLLTTPDGFHAVVLDNVGDTHNYLKINVSEVMLGFAGSLATNEGYAQGWTATNVTDLSAYTVIGTFANAVQVDFASITSRPSTLSGYGITNAISTSGGNITGTLTTSLLGVATLSVTSGFKADIAGQLRVVDDGAGNSAQFISAAAGVAPIVRLVRNNATARTWQARIDTSGGFELFDETAAGSRMLITTSSLVKFSVADMTLGSVATGAIGSMELKSGGGSPVARRILFGTDGTGWELRIAKNQAGAVTDIVQIKDNALVTVNGTLLVTKNGVSPITANREDDASANRGMFVGQRQNTIKWMLGTDTSDNFALLDSSGAGKMWITLSNGNATFTGDITASAGSVDRSVILNGNSGHYRGLLLRSSGNNRWYLAADSTAESGTNVGSNLVLIRYVDSGVGDTIIQVTRSDGRVSVNKTLDLTSLGNQIKLSGGNVSGGVFTGNSPNYLYLADWNTGLKGFRVNLDTGDVINVDGNFIASVVISGNAPAGENYITGTLWCQI